MAFIDSAGFIGLYVSGDARHQEAITCRDQTLKFSRLFTSTAVMAETVAHIQRDHLVDQACLQPLIDDFLRYAEWVSLLPVDDEVLVAALKMVRERNERRFSLVDATNIVLMEKYQIDIIFSFDSLYDSISLRRGYNIRYITRVGPQI